VQVQTRLYAIASDSEVQLVWCCFAASSGVDALKDTQKVAFVTSPIGCFDSPTYEGYCMLHYWLDCVSRDLAGGRGGPGGGAKRQREDGADDGGDEDDEDLANNGGGSGGNAGGGGEDVDQDEDSRQSDDADSRQSDDADRSDAGGGGSGGRSHQSSPLGEPSSTGLPESFMDPSFVAAVGARLSVDSVSVILVQHIGTGSFGTVWKARVEGGSPTAPCSVAVKFQASELGRHEARVLFRLLGCDGIVRPVAFLASGPTSALVLQNVPGPSAELCAERLPTAQRLQFLHRVWLCAVDILACVHRLGVCHGDANLRHLLSQDADMNITAPRLVMIDWSAMRRV
jgi:hypothetical protein